MDNNYKCDYLIKNEKNELIKHGGSNACWSSLNTMSYYSVKPIDGHIYIHSYNRNKNIYSLNNLKSVIKLINKITHCELVREIFDGKKQSFIKYKLLKTYDQNLILLNFIRNLWWEQKHYDCKKFFEYLKNNINEDKDPLEILLEANRDASPSINVLKDHSNSINKNHAVIKTSKELLKYKGSTTIGFLTKV